MSSFVFVALILISSLYDAVKSDFESSWRAYTEQFSKNYSTTNASFARTNFIEHFTAVNIHNNRFAAGLYNYTVGLNQFSDMDLDEALSDLCQTFYTPEAERGLPLFDLASLPLGPLAIDLTSLFQPIVNQGSCGSCWAYSTVAQLEALYRQTSMFYNYKFSPQYLIDCSRVAPNSGCSGGWPRVAMSYILATGMPYSSDYPATGVQASCKSPLPPFASPKLGNAVVQYNLKGQESYLENLVAYYGAIVIVMKASPNFMLYKSGVFSDTLDNCPADCTNVNHAMVVVGYGTELLTGIKYWIIRNSWGRLWGEGGYVRMLRNGSNNCNVACYAMFITSQ